ncbi:laminin subunit gamma-1 isoform X2 [Cimex lectularius]|uniref:Laminin subunit gamma-1 n=1 Tax=Cimex lectularius TaxID=79782 RepID=A0A8I6RCH4_CIMLE|nr:laminin subunit gamma-1 isoform X2 [Cimex lectularius]
MFVRLLLCSVVVGATNWDGITPWFFDSTCNCNGYSQKCFYDQKLYEETGHGGHCLDCTANRDGPHCERCRDNYYLDEDTKECLPCDCNEIGSMNLQCNSNGKCICKFGVDGEKCEKCGQDFYDFSITGCKACNCSQLGSLNTETSCDKDDGRCSCKENVEGKECQKCKPGYFNLDEFNEFGCTPCFCYGHSTSCDSAIGYSRVWLESMFARNNEKWSAVDDTSASQPLHYNPRSQDISVVSKGRESVYFLAPKKYLGDQRASYNQDLQFKLWVGEKGAAPSVSDIILESNGRQISQTIFGQGNTSPSTTPTFYKFRLHEHGDHGWQPKLSSIEFISILSNLTAIKIRGTYTTKGSGYLDQLKLGSAARQAAGQAALWIERCSCPTGFIGQFCESCSAGYKHEPPNGGPFAQCVPCTCNGHAETCDPDTGRCICENNTAGDNCERCAQGFYGNALAGTPNDCKPCPCINNGPCSLLPDSSVVCSDCPDGYAGAHCDICGEGYFGVATGNNTRPDCQPCDCNMNIDPNAINNCDKETGECLKCIYNTRGFHCDQCLEGFYGDALSPEKGDCKPCLCYEKGTEGGANGAYHCNQVSGQCQCKPNVIGTNCDQCKPGYYDLESGEGCKPCNCNITGSVGTTCDLHSGQCICAAGVMGLQCDKCETYHYGFFDEDIDGCSTCDCDPIGSLDLQCNETGHCPCLENFEGEKCDRCKENKHDKKKNCIDCPHCYNLVQDEVNKHRENLAKLKDVMENLRNTPLYHDVQFDEQIVLVTQMVDNLWKNAKSAAGDDNELEAKIEELRKKFNTMKETTMKIVDDLKDTEFLVDEADNNATSIKQASEKSIIDVKNAMEHLTVDGLLALNLARNKSKESGQKNQLMTDIAHRARTIVTEQLNEVKETEMIAKNAFDTCEEAIGLLNQAKDKQTNATRELEQLSTDIEQARMEMDRVTKLANNTLDTVSKAYQEALNFAVEINNLVEPQVDVGAIRSETDMQLKRLEDLQISIQKAEEQYKEETSGIEDELVDSQKNLERAMALQKEADLLMARADAAKKKAEEAVALGDNTLKEAQEVLASMKDFDKKSQISKEKANKELERIPEIETLLFEATSTTINAQEALQGALVNAKNSATMAKKVEEEMSDKVSNDLKTLKESVNKGTEDAEKMVGIVKAVDQRVGQLEEKIEKMKSANDENIKFTEMAVDKVGKAKNNTDEAERQVVEALKKLELIEKELSDLTDIDEDTLNQLEIRFKQVQDDFDNSIINEKLLTLTKDKAKQQALLKQHEESYNKLEAEVDNIRRIALAIPDSCFNKETNLEP